MYVARSYAVRTERVGWLLAGLLVCSEVKKGRRVIKEKLQVYIIISVNAQLVSPPFSLLQNSWTALRVEEGVMHHKVLTVLVVAAVAVLSSCQECDYPTNSDLEDVIKVIILTGDNPSPPIVSVMSFRPLCLAFGVERGGYHVLSVLVNYTCTGNPNCPQGVAEEQIESECVSSSWSNNVASSTDNTRSEVSEATSATITREDCSFCVSPELIAADDGLTFTTDNVTHCVGESIAYYYLLSAITVSGFSMTPTKSNMKTLQTLFLGDVCFTACNAMCDEGNMRCSGLGADDCCNFYNDSVCVDECPSPFLGTTITDTTTSIIDHVCVCPVGTTGFNCTEGESRALSPSICMCQPTVCFWCLQLLTVMHWTTL